MARLRTSIPLGQTNEVFGVIFDLGVPSRSDSEFRFDNGTIIIDGDVFAVDTILLGKNLEAGTSGRVTGIRIDLNNGEQSYVFDQFDASVLQVARAVDGDFNNIVRIVGVGADEFIGSTGDDIMRGFGGDDLIEGRGGNDFLTADAGNDMVLAGGGNDSVFAGAGNDDVQGGDGNDFLVLAGGNDTAVGGTGDDTINGQGGNDQITGGSGADSLNGGAGADTLIGQGGSDSIKGGGRADMIFAGGGSDTIKAGGGDDMVRANGGRDFIDGGGGDDLLFGGGGKDTFAFKNNSGDDIVRDFRLGKDMLDLSRARDIEDFTDLITNHTSELEGDLVIAVSQSSDVTIENVLIADLSESDFIF